MATKATPEYSAVGGPRSQRWDIVIHLVDGKPRPQGDWRTEMKVGDQVHFVSPDGKVRVEFQAIDQDGKHNPKGLLPFGSEKKNLEIEGAEEFHTIENRSQFVMYCYIKPHGKERYEGWGEDDPKAGTGVKTGGGG